MSSAKDRSASIREVRRRGFTARLRPGEKLRERFAADCAECDCEGYKHYAGVPIIAIAEGTHAGRPYQRCLECGTAWTRREFRWQPATVIELPRVATQGEAACPT